MRSKRLVAFCSPSPRSVRGPDEPDELAGFDQQRDDGLMVGAADIFSVQRDGTDWRRVHKAALGHLLHTRPDVLWRGPLIEKVHYFGFVLPNLMPSLAE